MNANDGAMVEGDNWTTMGRDAIPLYSRSTQFGYGRRLLNRYDIVGDLGRTRLRRLNRSVTVVSRGFGFGKALVSFSDNYV